MSHGEAAREFFAKGIVMTRYVALLRGINVGGYRLIRMDELARIFSAAGLKHVRTYIQSGNVVFDSTETNSELLNKRIEKKLATALGYEVKVLLRPLVKLERTVKRNPFNRIPIGPDVMLNVVFLFDEPKSKPKLPLISAKEKLELFEIKDGAAFVISRRKQNGWFGFPNGFVEKALGVRGTTRQWKTVNKIVSFANALSTG